MTNIKHILEFIREHKVDVGYGIMEKSANEDKKYTFGVCYKATNNPDQPLLDAHNEWVTGDILQESQWGYVKKGNRDIHLQHGMTGQSTKIGEWVDIVTWPQEVVMEFKLPDGSIRKGRIPANSVFMGILWTDQGWALVKSGKIRGISLGGMARRKRA